AVVQEVVLGHPHRVESEFLRAHRHLDGVAVEVGVGAGIARIALAGDESEADLHAADHRSVEPPSIGRAAPVMYAASSDARNTIVAATSAAVPSRRNGTDARR